MNKIDFVLAWVDGADKEWLAERRKYNLQKVQIIQLQDTGTGKIFSTGSGV